MRSVIKSTDRRWLTEDFLCNPYCSVFSFYWFLRDNAVTDSESKLFEKAKQAFEKNNYDYAIDLFGEVVKGQPDNTEARQMLRQTEVRKASSEGYPNAFMAKVRGLIPWLKTKLSSDPESIIAACEDYLKVDPYNIPVRIELAKALHELGHLKSAIGELKPLAEDFENKPEVHKQLGKFYSAAGQSKKATDHLKKVRELDPTDREVESMIKNAMAESTVQEGGWEEAESTQDLIRDEQKAEQLERQKKILTEPDEINEAISDLRGEVEELEDDSELFEKWKRIGELYEKLDDYEDAAEAYQNAFDLRPKNSQLKMKIGDMKLKKWENKIHDLEEKLEQNPNNEELQKKLEKVRKKQLKQQLEEFGQRVKDHPTDMKLRFKYGQFLNRAGKYDEAIKQFQQAAKDPNVRVKALNHLGQGFMKKGLADMAIDQFEKGLENCRSRERERELKYNLARAHIEEENWEEAETRLRSILEEDYGYRDAVELLEDVKEKNTG